MRFISLLFLCLPFATAAKSNYTPCTVCFDQASATQLAAIELRLYTGTTVDNYTTVLIGNASKLLAQMDSKKPTALYVFGWIGYPDQDITQSVVHAYVSRGDYNFLLLDWKKIAYTEYTFAARSSESVGWILAMALNDLVASGLNTTGMNVIGHSLGAPVCGFAGRYTNFTLPRITGLDPAAPGFYLAADNLASGDAKFVSIVHTNFGLVGIGLRSGDVDFFVNGGISQPACSISLEFCSHNIAAPYYADSIRYQNSFIGIACDSYAHFKAGNCSSNATVVMDDTTPIKTRGNYYLETNSKSPYGRGKKGLVFNETDEPLVKVIQDGVAELLHKV